MSNFIYCIKCVRQIWRDEKRKTQPKKKEEEKLMMTEQFFLSQFHNHYRFTFEKFTTSIQMHVLETWRMSSANIYLYVAKLRSSFCDISKRNASNFR